MLIFENILWLVVLIGVMILIHELGHFWAARFFDVHVEAFSIGFGPRLFGFRRGETDFRFSAILFGGYVKMLGEQPGEDSTSDPRALQSKPRWQRLIIAFAGPFMNIVLAVALLTGMFMVKYQKVAEPQVRGIVGHVLADSPAAKAGIQEGDRIARIEGIDNPSWEQIAVKEVAGAYKPLTVMIERNGQTMEKQVTPELDDRLGIGMAGWVQPTEIRVGEVSPGLPAEKAGLRQGDVLLSANGEAIRSPYKLQEVIRGTGGKPVVLEIRREGKFETITLQPILSDIDGDGEERWVIGVGPRPHLELVTTQLSLPEALSESLRQNIQSASLIGQFLKGMVEQRMSAKSMSGPIGIAQLSGEAAREGPSAFIHLMSMVSLNLAIFNLLPIPILDGGVIVMLLVEMLMRRDLSLTVKEAVLKVGFVFLMMVVVFVIYNDISKLLPAG
ncbi:MAG: RIP metalloprotease RseP [Bryobacteraceae bacterium]